MKSLMFIIALLSIACAVECRDIDREAVKQLFKDDVRDLIDGTQEDTNDRFLSDRALAPLQDDNSDICDCKDKCPKPELPAHLLVSLEDFSSPCFFSCSSFFSIWLHVVTLA